MTVAIVPFAPDPVRAAAVDAEVRAAVADSIATVLAPLQAQGAIAADDAVSIVASVRGAGGPGAVGAYVELVEAIHRDRPGDARAALDALAAASGRRGPGLRCVTLVDGDLGHGQADRYRRIIADDPTTPISIRPLDPPAMAREAARVSAALALLDRGAPEAAGELRALIREIVLVGPDGAGAGFGGATSFHLWGALFLNAEAHPGRLALAEALVHECGHALLFGLAGGGRLVEGTDDGRHASPLRDDPRPMDGVVHATFVLARMAWCMERLLAAGVLDRDEQAAARAAAAGHRRLFADGLAEIATHARLTPTGRAALAGAAAWIGGV
ncbi:MAG: HEXXH motif-containing putative peptide modification protein [Alphaproteobacteria bacterium]